LSDDDLIGAAALSTDHLVIALRERVEDLAQTASLVDEMTRTIGELEARVDSWKAEALELMERLP
jgi:hypothetical protein